MSQKTLDAVFADPVRANIHWDKIESLIKWLGGDVTKGGGSSVAFHLNGIRAIFHSPHPQKEASRGLIKRLRGFLEDAGVH
ncbi:MAG TPA: type II toxin-antitoxin system HicA family toxin [Gemmataceae bacterium]|jgi:hypothetical protein|nr:type II toxin-antitoxin system HicA family toxin [Gemmataceae bacterium]